MGPNFFSGRRYAAARRSAPRAPPESWPSVGGLASRVHAHRLALAQVSGQELSAWGPAKRQPAPGGRVARPVRLVAGGRAGLGLAAVLEAVWQVVVEIGHGAVQAVQHDGRQQQQQRGSGGGDGEEQEKQCFRADGRPRATASCVARQKFSITARPLKSGRFKLSWG